MAKKSSPAKKPATKTAPPKRAALKAQPEKKKPIKKKATARAAKASPAKKSPIKLAASKKTAAKKPNSQKPVIKQTAKKSKPAKTAPEGYLATLNHWRQSAVAGVRTIVQKPAETTRGLWQRVPAPRKLLQETGAKLWQVNLGRLKDAGKKELQELVHLAARLSEIGSTSARPRSGRGKRK